MERYNRIYPVNKGKKGDLDVKEHMVKAVSGLLDNACEENGKVLCVRFDVRYPSGMSAPGDNNDISRFMSKLVQKYSRESLNPRYIWKREKGTSENPHYHCFITLNGNKTRRYSRVFDDAEKLWQSTISTSQSGLIDRCNRHENGMLIVRASPNFASVFDSVHHQATYLCKENGSAPMKDGLRDFGVSRLTHNTKKEKS